MNGSARLLPIAHHDVGLVRLGQAIEQTAQVRNLELAVAISEGDELVARGLEAAAHGRAVAQVGLVVNGADARIAGGQAVGNLGRLVAAAVVDGDDLELVRERRQHLERLGHERLDVLRLVVRGKEERQLRDARTRLSPGPIGGQYGSVGHGRDYRLGGAALRAAPVAAWALVLGPTISSSCWPVTPGSGRTSYCSRNGP